MLWNVFDTFKLLLMIFLNVEIDLFLNTKGQTKMVSENNSKQINNCLSLGARKVQKYTHTVENIASSSKLP